MTVTTLDTSISPLPFSQGGTNAITAEAAYINLLAIRSISAITTLDATDFGKTIICGGASAYTVTLPTPTNGKTIRFVFNTTSNAIVTLSPPSGTMSGQATLKFGTYESCEIYSDGTNWNLIRVTLQPCLAGASAGTTGIAQNVETVLPANTKLYDIGSFFNTSTHIYTPKYPGIYDIDFTITFHSGSSFTNGSLFELQVLFSGTDVYAPDTRNGGTSNEVTVVGHYSQEMNGSTDTLTVRAYQTDGSVVTFDGYVFYKRVSQF